MDCFPIYPLFYTPLAVLKLSRSTAERRSGSFLEAGAALQDF